VVTALTVKYAKHTNFQVS